MTCYLPEGNTFYYYGYCEANLTNFFLRAVQPNMTIIDVGAHVGIYSMLGAELVGTNGKVHSFEPTPWTYSLLNENTKQYKQVKTFNSALADRVGEVTFADYGPGYGAYNTANQSGAAALKNKPRKTTVSTTTLDRHCTEKNLAPDIIKLDAEGYEFAILQGANNLLEKVRPIITLEVAGGDAWSKNQQQSFSLLKNHRYAGYEITTAGFLKPHTFKDTYSYDNLVFLPEEKIKLLAQFLV